MLRFCLLHTAKHKGVIVQVLSAVTVQSASLIFMFTVICSAYYGVTETQSAANYMSL